MNNKAIDRGYVFDLEFELQKTDKTPQVIAGTTAVWRLATSPDAAVPLLERTGLTPVTVSGKSVVQLTLTEAETEGLTGDKYYHQLAVSLSGGPPRPYFKGWIPVEASL